MKKKKKKSTNASRGFGPLPMARIYRNREEMKRAYKNLNRSKK
tara:strand:+ start:564 stop:692 length:129 start_codon:yes stop_codon:yes gene_type:complete